MDLNAPCLACRIVRGETPTSGGLVSRGEGLVVHALAQASPLEGWMVITSERHVRAWADLPGPELSALGPLAARIMRAQKDLLGAEHVYAMALGDALHHFHLHLVPRYANTPAHLRGRGAFDARPEEALAEDRLVAAVGVLRSALAARR